MKNNLIILPKTLTFITTLSCTATCKNCCFSCSPKRKERLSLNDMKHLIDRTIELYPSIDLVVLTGGESFLLGQDLFEIVEYITSKNLYSRIVTNGYWAKNYDIAFKKLQTLVDRGLTEINFSTGDDHLQYVPCNNIVNGIVACMELNIPTVINVEYGKDRIFKSNSLLNNPIIKKYLMEKDKYPMLKIMNSVWMPFKKSTSIDISKSEKPMGIKISPQRCNNLFNGITINANYQMLSCCGLTSIYSKYLNLGNVKQKSLKELFENQFNDFLKIWIYTDGPYAIIDFISKEKGVTNPFSPYNHICEICANIFNSEENITILKNNYNKIYSDIIFRYLFNKNTNKNEKI